MQVSISVHYYSNIYFIFSRVWQRIADHATQIGSRGRLKRFFTSDSDAAKLEGLVTEISDSIQTFLVR